MTPDCTREKAIGTHPYPEVVEAREECGCMVCRHDLPEARRRARMSEQATLGDVSE